MDIGGGVTWTADDPETFTWSAGPAANTPEAGANYTTFNTTRLAIPPYTGRGCFIVTAAVPAGGTAADQRTIIAASAFDKLVQLEGELVGGGTVVAGVNGFSWLQGKLSADRAHRKTTCFANKALNDVGGADEKDVLVAASGVYPPGAVSDETARDATTDVVNNLINCLTPP